MDVPQNLPPNLPFTGTFVDRLISELATCRPPTPSNSTSELQNQDRTSSAHQQQQPQNPLSRLPASQLANIKPVMLTLHCLFPNDLLLALDILDRQLVQRFVRTDEIDAAATSPETETPSKHQHSVKDCTAERSSQNSDQGIFLVTSASTAPSDIAPPTSHFGTHSQEKGYEVRLRAWNCTCPTFALSAYRDSSDSVPDSGAEYQVDDEMGQDPEIAYPFGGTLTRATARLAPPVCKHILACVLLVRCPGLFGADGNGRRVVSAEEVAGWCAGWTG